MFEVSDAWKDVQQRFLLPETFVEISCEVAEPGIRKDTTSIGENESEFSVARNVVKNTTTTAVSKYATLEPNLWLLDGSAHVLQNNSSYSDIGYVSSDDSLGKIIISLDEVERLIIPGVTIVWSNEFKEYATKFSVTIKNGNTVVATRYIDDNTTNLTYVDVEFSNYDTVEIEIYEWCLPNHRFRVHQVFLGYLLVFTKNEILTFTHDQYGDVNSGEIPKNSIEFSIHNLDDAWNPNNPKGMMQYLSERQKVVLKYGLRINADEIEWIKVGEFYLSEWRTPANGLEMFFVARDCFEYMLNEPYLVPVFPTTLQEILQSATQDIQSVPFRIFAPSLSFIDDYSTGINNDYTVAEVVQKAANAGGCCMRHRIGELEVQFLDTTLTDYVIPSALSYSHPEITLSKNLKAISVKYNGESTIEEEKDKVYVLEVGESGETQTVENSFISSEEQAEAIAIWIRNTLSSRKTVKGEYRPDPRLELFDVVSVESKYGVISPVVITSLKYTYSGSFRAEYTGLVL